MTDPAAHTLSQPGHRPLSRLRWLWYGVLLALILAVLAAVGLGLWLAQRFLRDEPVVHADPVAHFLYGSTGGERTLGFPYWIWQVLPQVCASHLPDASVQGAAPHGWERFGLLYAKGQDLPMGMSKRRQLGIDRVFLNCAVCHVSTVRTAADAEPRAIPGMPANTLDLMAFQRFFLDCVTDARFTPNRVMAEIDARGADLDLLDRHLVYPLAVHLMRDQVIALLHRLRFFQQNAWGPGRVDTFNSAKAIFSFPMEDLAAEELVGVADFPSIWNQGRKQGLQLHWDGNNDKVEERNLSAAFGTGATPTTVDHGSLGRVESWLAVAEPPPFSASFPVDVTLAARGEPIYREYCARCHGQSGKDFSGERVGRVTPIAEIGTDPYRLQSYTHDLAVNQGTLYAGDPPYRFTRFRKTFGYANMPLDGLWLRAPYLHNGSVPTLWDLLQTSETRPKRFYRGNDLYDPKRLGFVSDQPAEGSRRYFQVDTGLPGNGNAGHSGRAYGTDLPESDKWALVEYLKTF